MQMQLQRHAFSLSNGKQIQRASSSSFSSSSSPQVMKMKAQMREIQSLLNWVDDIKEGGMRKKKAVYNHEDWVEHRSSNRHIRHFMSSLSSRVILSLIPPVCIFTGIAALVGAYNTVVEAYGSLSLPLLHASSLPYQLTAPALALLLVFRTEASYARYEEGRTAWNKVIGLVMDFARQANAGIRHPDDTHLKNQLLDYIVAFPFALKCHIIYGSDIRCDLERFLPDNDISIVLSSQHPPNCIIQFMSECLRQLHLNDHERNSLDSHLSQFNENIAVCQSLIETPIPLSYTRLTSRFLVLWHLTLPIILWDQCEWMVVPATFISAASLFCIEEVGVLIEEPFPMLALDQICSLAHDNIREMIRTQKLIDEHLNSKEGKLFTDKLGSNGTGRGNREENLRL